MKNPSSSHDRIKPADSQYYFIVAQNEIRAGRDPEILIKKIIKLRTTGYSYAEWTVISRKITEWMTARGYRSSFNNNDVTKKTEPKR